MAALLRGMPTRDAADLYNAYLYGFLGYYDADEQAEAQQVLAAREH